ncbi:hypothetical protein A2U01_0059636, partial [Trifolium medium]|nr:hypothetical protein [Trifolium medium]
ESMYRMQLYQGVPQNPDYQVMAPQHFQTHIAWPGDRPFHPEEVNQPAGDDDAAGGNDIDVAADAVDDDEAMEGDDDEFE